MPKQLSLPARPAAFEDVPRLRYWGERKPPKNRADMFAVTITPLAAADAAVPDASGGSTSGNVATLRMYGPIDSWGGFWGISAKDVSAALDDLGQDVTEIRLRINSPGGEAWEGMAITNLLRAHRCRVVAVVDGIAASAASFIAAAAADETVMSPGTQMMIHDASGFAFGPAAIMRKSAESLDSVSNSIASLYAEAAGGSVEDWRAVMVEETWYTATEAVGAGLADRVAVVADAGETSTAGDDPQVVPDPTGGEEVENHFDLSIFNYAGRSHAPAPKPPSASASGSRTTTQEGSPVVAFTDDQLTSMRQALGVPEDADEATIVAALGEALNERAEPEPAPAGSTVPEGHVVIPEARLRDLEAGAQAGSQAAEQLRIQNRTQFLDSVRTKFAPANRAAWEKEYDRDPEGTRKYFASAPDIIPVEPIGHDDASDTLSPEDEAALQAWASTLGVNKEDLRG